MLVIYLKYSGFDKKSDKNLKLLLELYIIVRKYNYIL